MSQSMGILRAVGKMSTKKVSKKGIPQLIAKVSSGSSHDGSSGALAMQSAANQQDSGNLTLSSGDAGIDGGSYVGEWCDGKFAGKGVLHFALTN